MQVFRNDFDRNKTLFDASSSLTAFRELAQKEKDAEILSFSTQDRQQVKTNFPRLYSELEKFLVEEGRYILYFFPKGQGGDIEVMHPFMASQSIMSLFFISSKTTCQYQPGDRIDFKPGETMILKYSDLSYGFIGVCLPESRGSENPLRSFSKSS